MHFTPGLELNLKQAEGFHYCMLTILGDYAQIATYKLGLSDTFTPHSMHCGPLIMRDTGLGLARLK